MTIDAGVFLTFRFVDGRACPFFRCHCCKGYIEDIGMAWIVWDMKREQEGQTELFAVHKGACLEALEDVIERGHDGFMGSIEISEFLDQLNHNCGVFSRNARREHRERVLEKKKAKYASIVRVDIDLHATR